MAAAEDSAALDTKCVPSMLNGLQQQCNVERPLRFQSQGPMCRNDVTDGGVVSNSAIAQLEGANTVVLLPGGQSLESLEAELKSKELERHAVSKKKQSLVTSCSKSLVEQYTMAADYVLENENGGTNSLNIPNIPDTTTSDSGEEGTAFRQDYYEPGCKARDLTSGREWSAQVEAQQSIQITPSSLEEQKLDEEQNENVPIVTEAEAKMSEIGANVNGTQQLMKQSSDEIALDQLDQHFEDNLKTHISHLNDGCIAVQQSLQALSLSLEEQLKTFNQQVDENMKKMDKLNQRFAESGEMMSEVSALVRINQQQTLELCNQIVNRAQQLVKQKVDEMEKLIQMVTDKLLKLEEIILIQSTKIEQLEQKVSRKSQGMK